MDELNLKKVDIDNPKDMENLPEKVVEIFTNEELSTLKEGLENVKFIHQIVDQKWKIVNWFSMFTSYVTCIVSLLMYCNVLQYRISVLLGCVVVMAITVNMYLKNRKETYAFYRFLNMSEILDMKKLSEAIDKKISK